MPYYKSCKKSVKTSGERRASNRECRSATRGAIKTFRDLAGTEDKTPESLSAIYSVLDVQARKGVIPKTRASRLKARLASLYAK